MKPRIPRRLLLELTVSMLRREPRSPLADARRMLAGLPRAPIIEGLDHLPRTGPYSVIANHYQRWDLWIGWTGALLIDAIGQPIHWLVLRDLPPVPFSRALFARVSATYGFVPASAPALRQPIRLLQAGEVVGFFPEGQRGHAGRLSPALPEAAKLAARLSREAPLLPAAVAERDGHLVARFGQPFRLEEPDPARLTNSLAVLLTDC